MSERGICPVCGREYALQKAGTMRYHWAPAEIRRYQGYDCKGYGQPPKSTVDDPLAAAERHGWDQAIAALRERGAGTAVGRLLARTDGDVNGIQIAAALADYLTAVRDTPDGA